VSALVVAIVGGCGGSSAYDANRTAVCLNKHRVRTKVGPKVQGGYGEWLQIITAQFSSRTVTDLWFYPSSSDARAGQGLVRYPDVRTEFGNNVQWVWHKPVPHRADALIRSCLR
jgi:hypothetical protein